MAEWGRKTFQPHPEGIYVGTFVNYQDKEGQWGPQVLVEFDSTELMDDGKPYRVGYFMNADIGPKSKATKFLKMFNYDTEEMDPADVEGVFDALIESGAKVQMVIEEYQRKDGTMSTKISNLLPMPKARPKANAQPATQNAQNRPQARSTATVAAKSAPAETPDEQELWEEDANQ